MYQRIRFVAEDSMEAMEKITRELGEDARIFSTRAVQGGIEIIAGHADSVDEDPDAIPTKFAESKSAQQKSSHLNAAQPKFSLPKPGREPNALFTSFHEQARMAKANGVRQHLAARLAEQTPEPPPEPAPVAAAPVAEPVQEPVIVAMAAPAPQVPPVDNARLQALESSLAEIKAMLGSEMMSSGLRAAGAPSALISMFLAQADAFEGANVDQKFGAFLARRLLHNNPPALVGGPRVVVTLGASGSGKTTVLAQLAARIRLRQPNARIALVNADITRIGATEELRALGKILDVPVLEVGHLAELSDFAQSADRQITMLVDMPSKREECGELLERIEKRSGGAASIVRIGVVASNLSCEAIDQIYARHPDMDAIALTKLTESRINIAALSRLSLRQTGVAYLSTNSHLTRGFVEPDAAAMEDLIRCSLPGAIRLWNT